MDNYIYMEHSSFTDAAVAIDTASAHAVMAICSSNLNQLQVKKFEIQDQSSTENTFDALAYFHQKGFVICSRTWFETVRLRALKNLNKNIYELQPQVA